MRARGWLRLLPVLGLGASADVREASYPANVTVRQGPLQLHVAGGIG